MSFAAHSSSWLVWKAQPFHFIGSFDITAFFWQVPHKTEQSRAPEFEMCASMQAYDSNEAIPCPSIYQIATKNSPFQNKNVLNSKNVTVFQKKLLGQ